MSDTLRLPRIRRMTPADIGVDVQNDVEPDDDALEFLNALRLAGRGVSSSDLRPLLAMVEKAKHVDVAGHFVYIMWGADRERPLYIGETAHLLRRMGNHRDKVDQVLTVQLLPFATEQERSAAEYRLIMHFRPTLNSLHLSGRRPPNDRSLWWKQREASGRRA